MEFFEDLKKPDNRMPFGHWTQTDSENIKNFLKTFVEKKKFDPKVAENWYSISTDDIIAEKVFFKNNLKLYQFQNFIVVYLFFLY